MFYYMLYDHAFGQAFENCKLSPQHITAICFQQLSIMWLARKLATLKGVFRCLCDVKTDITFDIVLDL